MSMRERASGGANDAMSRQSERGEEERLVVALVRGVHGLNGAVRAEVLTDRPEDRFAVGGALFREGDDRPLTIASAEAVADGPGWRLRFREIATRDAADSLRGAYLEMVVQPEEDLARGAYYWHEVIGCAVRGVDGTELGTVKDIYRVGETEVFSVTGGPVADFDLPAVRAFIRIFAPRRGEIVVDAESLDLRPRRAPETDRPKAPRRRSRKPIAPAEAATDVSRAVDAPTAPEAPGAAPDAAGGPHAPEAAPEP
jgi:16S rRNA processing protein RimM